MQMVLIPWGLWGSLGYMNHTLKIANIEDNYKDVMSLEPKELIWEEPTNFKVKLLTTGHSIHRVEERFTKNDKIKEYQYVWDSTLVNGEEINREEDSVVHECSADFRRPSWGQGTEKKVGSETRHERTPHSPLTLTAPHLWPAHLDR